MSGPCLGCWYFYSVVSVSSCCVQQLLIMSLKESRYVPIIITELSVLWQISQPVCRPCWSSPSRLLSACSEKKTALSTTPAFSIQMKCKEISVVRWETFLNDMMYIWMHYYGVAQPVNLPRALPSRALCLLVPPRTQNELILLLTKINLWTRRASEPPAPRVFLVFSFSLSKISLKTCFSSALIVLECIPVQTTNTPKRCLIKSALLLLPTLQSEDRSHD